MKSNLGGVERERKVRGEELKEGEDGKGKVERRRRLRKKLGDGKGKENEREEL